MPMLMTGYEPAAIPPPGDASDGLGVLVNGEDNEQIRGYYVTPTRQLADALGVTPAPVELRVPGVDDRPAYNPRAQLAVRTDAPDGDYWTVNNGSHVAQAVGASIPSGQMDGEPAVYGSTWRLEPAPADAGLYVGGR